MRDVIRRHQFSERQVERSRHMAAPDAGSGLGNLRAGDGIRLVGVSVMCRRILEEEEEEEEGEEEEEKKTKKAEKKSKKYLPCH